MMSYVTFGTPWRRLGCAGGWYSWYTMPRLLWIGQVSWAVLYYCVCDKVMGPRRTLGHSLSQYIDIEHHQGFVVYGEHTPLMDQAVLFICQSLGIKISLKLGSFF